MNLNKSLSSCMMFFLLATRPFLKNEILLCKCAICRPFKILNFQKKEGLVLEKDNNNNMISTHVWSESDVKWSGDSQKMEVSWCFVASYIFVFCVGRMSRLADYFVVVGFDHDKERKWSNIYRNKYDYDLYPWLLREIKLHLLTKSFTTAEWLFYT